MNLESQLMSLLEASLLRPLALAGLAWIVLRVFRVQHPASRHAVWTFVLMGMLAVPLASLFIPRMDLAILPARTSPAGAFEPIPEQPEPVASNSAPAASREVAASPVISKIPPGPVTRSVPITTFLLALYFTGVLAMSVYAATGWFLLRLVVSRSRRLGIHPLRESGDVVVPVAAGCVRPTVILPRDWRSWGRDTRHAALAHELAHIRRKDALVSAVGRLARTLLWFHPLAWWFPRELSRLAELACDASVLERGHDPARYSRVLLDFAARMNQAGRRAALPGLAMAGQRGLSQRIDQVFNFSRGMRRIRRPAAALSFAGIPAICLAAAVGVTAPLSLPTPIIHLPVPVLDTAAPPTMPKSAPILIAQAPTRPLASAAEAKPTVQTEPLGAIRFPAQTPGRKQLTIFDRQGNVVKTLGDYGWDDNPEFSPDGSRVAFMSSDGDQEDIWVANVSTGARTRITSSPAPERSPVWSPDGNQLAYVVTHQDYFDIVRKAADGSGSEELLYRHQGSVPSLSQWSPDGRYLFFFTPATTIFELPLEGERKPVELVRGQFVYGGGLSPDGKIFAYMGGGPYIQGFDSATGRLLPGEPKKVTDGGRLKFWGPDSKELYFLGGGPVIMAADVTASPLQASTPRVVARLRVAPPNSNMVVTGSMSQDGQRFVFGWPPPPPTQSLNVYNRRGQSLMSLGRSSYWYHAAFSPDGNHLAAIKNDLIAGTSDVWTFDLATAAGTPVTNDGTSHANPVWSSDGKQLVYTSFRNGAVGIYRKASDGSGAEELLYRHLPGVGIVLTDWSADGRMLSFWSGKSLYSLPLGSTQAVLAYTGNANNRAGRFSPDGRYLAYSSDRSGRFETYVAPFSATSPQNPGVQISDTGALGGIFWRQDQRELYYHNDGAIMAVDIASGSEFKAGTPRILFRLTGALGSPGQLSNISTRDGQRFVFAEDSR